MEIETPVPPTQICNAIPRSTLSKTDLVLASTTSFEGKMGIDDLHDIFIPHVKQTELTKIAGLKGKKVGVDAYSWLHKCKYEMENDRIYRYVEFFQFMVDSLKSINITPVLVFDGSVPLIKRWNRNTPWPPSDHDADDYDVATRISVEVAHHVVVNMKHRGIEVMVAPYEADSQLCFLAMSKYVEAVISEDSDLFVYKCPKIIHKLNITNWMCRYFEYQWKDDYCIFPEIHYPTTKFHNVTFRKFTPDMFVQFCVLCGSDYLGNIKGIGPIHAFELIKECKGDLRLLFMKLEKYKDKNPPSGVRDLEDYKNKFKMVLTNYNHQKVYCPITKNIRPMRNMSQGDIGPINYLGEDIPKTTAIMIAEGVINPIKHRPFRNEYNYKVQDRNYRLVEYIKHSQQAKYKHISKDPKLERKNTLFSSWSNKQRTGDDEGTSDDKKKRKP